MTDNHTAPIEVTGFSWVPPFARGLVRDLRVRWTLEELGQSYGTRLFDPRQDRAPVRQFQPFGQVPSLVEGDAHLFETGAICLWLAERSEALLPREAAARAEVMSWSLAALNSIEPFILSYQMVSFFDKDKPGAADYLPVVEARLRDRLAQLAEALGSQDWLAGQFSVADILMVHVLLPLAKNGALADHPALAAYVARGEARPACARALAAQIADFSDEEEGAFA